MVCSGGNNNIKKSHHPPHQHHRLRNGGSYSGLRTTSLFTILMLVCLETVLLSTVSNCAKTFYMHWNTSNSIFRIDNTDHIIDVNKGNSAFEFDQVHIICPVYEPGTYENETEKYIIYNVSKVEYETCRITNADPRVIAICDKPQKLMFFTITFRPFTPQPGGLEFLPGNDYYFISTSSKDDLYRRIGGRCSTNNMKVVFKVCCAPEQKNTTITQANNNSGSTGTNSDRDRNNNSPGVDGGGGGAGGVNGGILDNSGTQQHNNNVQNAVSSNNPIGGQGNNGGGGSSSGVDGSNSKSLNTNIDQYNRISQINGGVGGGGSFHQQNGIRVNTQQNPARVNSVFIPPMTNINTNSSNVVQSTMSWPSPPWIGNGGVPNSATNGIGGNLYPQHSTPVTTIGIQTHFYPPYMTSSRPNINSAVNNNSNYSPSYKTTKKTNEYDKHPNEVVKNEELTYNSGASSIFSTLRNIHSNRRKLYNCNSSTSSIFSSASTYILSTLNKIFIVMNNKLNKLLILLLVLSNSNLLSIIINLNFLSNNNIDKKINNNNINSKNSGNIDNQTDIKNQINNKNTKKFCNIYSSCKNHSNNNNKTVIYKNSNIIYNTSINDKKSIAINIKKKNLIDKNDYKKKLSDKNCNITKLLFNYTNPILILIIVLITITILIDILTNNLLIMYFFQFILNSFNLHYSYIELSFILLIQSAFYILTLRKSSDQLLNDHINLRNIIFSIPLVGIFLICKVFQLIIFLKTFRR